jgi:hypothetical protein
MPFSLATELSHLASWQGVLWCAYLLAAIMLPAYHVPPILKYLRGTGGIGDACIRTELIQCLWRLPALLFSVFVLPSLPLFLSISLDMLGRSGRVLAMWDSQRRFRERQAGHRLTRQLPSRGATDARS